MVWGVMGRSPTVRRGGMVCAQIGQRLGPVELVASGSSVVARTRVVYAVETVSALTPARSLAPKAAGKYFVIIIINRISSPKKLFVKVTDVNFCRILMSTAQRSCEAANSYEGNDKSEESSCYSRVHGEEDAM